MAITAAAHKVIVVFIAFLLGYGLSPNCHRQVAMPTSAVSSSAFINAPQRD
ncbi:MAG: hypothetical protein IPI51_03400 [Betaproteobacteria bacterium]|jgi:hypothetical protein|nr:hypothetical protein [Betaproteobacteria bacterium]MBK9682105.1 hypothetical protein [Betaproteobacteria bacterium]